MARKSLGRRLGPWIALPGGALRKDLGGCREGGVAQSSRRTIGLGAALALAWRLATTVNPARSNIETVPL
jgi:hypothetical protein